MIWRGCLRGVDRILYVTDKCLESQQIPRSCMLVGSIFKPTRTQDSGRIFCGSLASTLSLSVCIVSHATRAIAKYADDAHWAVPRDTSTMFTNPKFARNNSQIITRSSFTGEVIFKPLRTKLLLSSESCREVE